MAEKVKKVTVKFYCSSCGKEIWQGMDDDTKKTLTVAEAERTAICWNCLNRIEKFKEEPVN